MVADALETKTPLAFVAVYRPAESPTTDDMYSIGTAATIQRMWHLPDGSIRLLVHGIQRIKISKTISTKPHLCVLSQQIKSSTRTNKDLQALFSGVSGLFQQLLSLSAQQSDELQIAALNIDNPDRLADFIAFHLNLDLSEKQHLLEESDTSARLQRLSRHLTQELEVLELGAKIRSRVQSELDRGRKEHLIREQIRALQYELGEADAHAIEIESLRHHLTSAEMPAEAYNEATRELDRLTRMPTGAAEYTNSRTYLDWLIDLPWNRSSVDNLDLKHAQRMLDRDHCGLDAVKNRLLDELAVRKLGAGSQSPILCLVGPPGVGKTSLGRSIARALNRKFVCIALGGLRDEAELRGHRRTYIGAMPGRIIQGLHRCGTRNPVMVLDEIDKLGENTGDPAAALLEILDPDQNDAFVDHYLNVPFDLSQILFITTANVLFDIPTALRDRLEIIALPGYLETEKATITRRHLLPRQQAIHGLNKKNLTLRPDAIRSLITHYTREPGLRNLDRAIATLCRKIARQIAEGKRKTITLSAKDLPTYIGQPAFVPDTQTQPPIPGLVTGLAATPIGGEHFAVEATAMPGSGDLVLTGQLGDVMKESARAALSYVRTQATQLCIDPDLFRKTDLHIHVPAGAVPKDGPSAGLAIAICLTSLFTNRPTKRDLAFTGEITLTGRVLRVGGISDKILAARRAGIRHVILPEANRIDLDNLPQTAYRGLMFYFVNTIAQALDTAFA